MAKKETNIKYRVTTFQTLIGAELKLSTTEGEEYEGVLGQLNVIDGVSFALIADKSKGEIFINVKQIASFNILKYDETKRDTFPDKRPCVLSNKGKAIKGCSWEMAQFEPKCDGCSEKPKLGGE